MEPGRSPLVTVLLGTVPILSFWAEHRATQRVRRERPHLQICRDDATAGAEPLSMSSRTAFVLGGGGLLGAVEVGMLRALFERDVQPDLVLGTSVGALNGLVVASDPTPAAVDRLLDLWSSVGESNEVYSDRTWRQVQRAVRTGTHLHSAKPLRERLEQEFGEVTFDELAVRVPVLRGQHRARRRALVHDGAGRPGGGGQRGGARACCRRRAWTASTTSTAAS